MLNERNSRPVPPDPIENIRRVLDNGMAANTIPMAACMEIERCLDQIQQGRGASPGGLTVEEIQKYVTSEARRLQVIVDEDHHDASMEDYFQLKQGRASATRAIADWISDPPEKKDTPVDRSVG